MRTFTLLALTLALLFPAAAWGAGETCTACDDNATAVDWGPITVMTNDCREGPAPDGDDKIRVPDDCVVTVVDPNITQTTAGAGITLEAGGTLQADASVVEDAIVFHLFDGDDNITVSGTAYDAVALNMEAGSQFIGQGGYLTWGQATPAYDTYVDETKMWTVDLFAPCDEAADNANSFEIGGDDNCTTGNQAYGFSIIYTDDRNDPQAGCGADCGDNYIEETLTHLRSKNHDHYIVTFLTGMEVGHSYTIQDQDIDIWPPTYAISLYTAQMEQGGAKTAVQYPIADRAQKLRSVTVAAAAGDNCIETAAGLLTADGQFTNACLYFYDSSGDNAFANHPPGPYRIDLSEDSQKCDGSTGGGEESYYLASDNPLPEALVVDDQIVISPLCVGQGDKFTVKAGVWLEMEEVTGWALGNSKVLCDDCYFRLRGGAVTGSGLVLCEGSGCLWDVDDSVFWGNGDNATPHIKFENATNAQMSCVEVVGGSQTAGSTGILFDGVTGLTDMTSVKTRYMGGPAFYSDNSTMGTAWFEECSCERTAQIASASGKACLNVADDWEKVTVLNLHAGNHGYGNTATIIKSTGTDVTVSGVSIVGQYYGSYVSQTSASYVKTAAALVRGVNTQIQVAEATWAGHHLTNSDIRHFNMNWNKSTDGYFMKGGELLLEDTYFEEFSTVNPDFLFFSDLDGIDTARNNTFVDGTSTHAECDSNTGCSIVMIAADTSTTDAGHVIEQNQFMWTKPTEFLSAVETSPTTGDAMTFGGNAVFGMVNELDNVTVYGFKIDEDMAANSTQRDMGGGKVLNNCVSLVDATGAAATATYVVNPNSYQNVPFLGIAPQFDGSGRALMRDSYLRQQLCASAIGTEKPGIPVGHSVLYNLLGIEEPERKPLVKKGLEDG